MSWIEVRATLPEGDDTSPFVEIFRGFGIENTQESGAELIGCMVDVEGSTEQLGRLLQALRGAGISEVATAPLVEQNWDEVWRQFFKPRRIGERFVVRPSWEEFASSAEDLVIVLDPGEAFGTGDHPTTRLCLELLERAEIKGSRVLDLGCGSGILAIGAVLLGATEVTAIDIDPTSVAVAEANATLNQVALRSAVGEGVPKGGRYQVVVSNIISAVLMQIAPDVAAALDAGGRWLVSGILVANWPLVLSAATRAGFGLGEYREEGDWVAALFERAPRTA